MPEIAAFEQPVNSSQKKADTRRVEPQDSSRREAKLGDLKGSNKVIGARKNMLEIEKKSTQKPSDAGGQGVTSKAPKNTLNISEVNIQL